MKEGAKNPASKEMPKDAGVSFSKDVAPVLVQHCGRCHVDKTTGGFTMPTYEGLMKGSRAGVVLFAGDPDGSPLVEAMVSGTMPPSGNKVPEEQLSAIKAWVKAGAKFDGEDPKPTCVCSSADRMPSRLSRPSRSKSWRAQARRQSVLQTTLHRSWWPIAMDAITVGIVRRED